jgi:ABC-type lipoprotein export system ATPase subunit
MKPILQTVDLKKSYKIGKLDVPALRGLSFDVGQGEFVAIMGPSGCGKSTLLHILGGLLSPTSGSVVIDGEDLTKVSDARRTDIRRRKIGFVFHDSIFPTLSAEGNLKLAEKIHTGASGKTRTAERGFAPAQAIKCTMSRLSFPAAATCRACPGGRKRPAMVRPMKLLGISILRIRDRFDFYFAAE